jgi:hypothetical protein
MIMGQADDSETDRGIGLLRVGGQRREENGQADYQYNSLSRCHNRRLNRDSGRRLRLR